MGYRLQMSAEIYDWLHELRDSDPTAAELTARALAALADDGDRLGPPLVIAVAARLSPDDLKSALDQHYQARLESMTALRRRVAGAATLRKRLELQLTEPEPSADPAGLRERLAAAKEAEEQLTVESQREQMRLDAFRTKREILKAAYTAAWTEQLIEQAQDLSDDAARPDDPAGVAGRLDEIIGQVEQELGPEASADGLMELRPAAPADSGIRILFAVEPPGTALLIAVLEGEDAVRDHYRDAVFLASDVLQEARASRAREEAAHAFGDAQSFLEEFFPGRAEAHPRPATTIRIGRTPDNDIALTRDLDVSRHHAELHRNPDGSYEIIDLGSHGGTFVNGERITRTLLTEQDTISIGYATFRLAGGELRQCADESPGRTPAIAGAHEVVAAYWAAAEARDWEAFGALLADDVIYRGPQTREQVRGRDPYVRFNVEGFTYDWHLTVQRIVGEGQHAASWIEFTGPEGTQAGLCFFDLADDGKIAAITDFWPDPYELPASRAHLVERY